MKNQKNTTALLIVYALIIIFGYLGFMYFGDKGHRKLSGNGNVTFVKREDADTAYNEVLTQLSLGKQAATRSKNPGFTPTYERSFYEGHVTWWRFEPGYIANTYYSIPLDQSLSDKINNNLQAKGWDIEYKGSETTFDIFRAFESAREKRAKAVQDVQESAVNPHCIASDLCQQDMEQRLNELNDAPLQVEYSHSKSPFWLDLTYTASDDFKTVAMDVRLNFACTTGYNCSGVRAGSQ